MSFRIEAGPVLAKMLVASRLRGVTSLTPTKYAFNPSRGRDGSAVGLSVLDSNKVSTSPAILCGISLMQSGTPGYPGKVQVPLVLAKVGC